MLNNKEFSDLGALIADSLLPVIADDITAQIDVKLEAAAKGGEEALSSLKTEFQNILGEMAEGVSKTLGVLSGDFKAFTDNNAESQNALNSKISEEVFSAKASLNQELGRTREDFLKITNGLFDKTSEVDARLSKTNAALEEFVLEAINKAFLETELSKAKEDSLEAISKFNLEIQAKLLALGEKVFSDFAGIQEALLLASNDHIKDVLDETVERQKTCVDAINGLNDQVSEVSKSVEVLKDQGILTALNDLVAKNTALTEVNTRILAENSDLEKRIATIETNGATALEKSIEESIGRMKAEITLQLFNEFQKTIERLPTARDGTNGRDGRDGRDGKFIDPAIYVDQKHYPYQSMVTHNGGTWYALRDTSNAPGSQDWQLIADGIKSVTLAHQDDLRSIELMFIKTSGDYETFEFDVPVPIYRGVFLADKTYKTGDIVTYDGSTWIATKDPIGKPKESLTWQLQTKRGSDGKSAMPLRDHVRGAFKYDETYLKGDLVDHGGRVWIAKINTKSVPPADYRVSNNDWSILS